jgi:hypothetical protein
MYASPRQKSRSAISKLLQTASDQQGASDKGAIKHTMTSVVSESIVVGEEPHPITRSNEVGILFTKLYSSMKKTVRRVLLRVDK